MRLEKIEITGFKSFAEKSVFSFQPGVTAVIGPNGCGKSNIVDALKWVLGDQSPKSMRGDKMEDLIFTGSEGRKPTGMAEVTLLLKDLNGSLPQGLSEYDEISITRRCYRSGESEYLINKVPCRLKDIRDLFLDTGLEARSYSIIEQGRIGLILNSKPFDRRFLIEEAAGVMKYKARRAEASQKLELAGQNLLRIKDITSEVERQINSLNRQVKKAERYKRLKEEVRSLELRILSIDYKDLGNELAHVNEGLERLTEEIAKAKARVSQGDADIEQKRLRLLEVEKTMESLQEGLLHAEKNLGQKEKDISLLKSDINSMRERQEKDKREIDILTHEETVVREHLMGIEIEGKRQNEEIEEKSRDVSSKEEILSSINGEISLLEESLEEAKISLFEKAAEISDVKNRITHLETLKDGVSKKEKMGEHETKDIETELAVKEEDLKKMKETLKGLEIEKNNLAEELKKTSEDIRDNEKKLAIIEEEFLRKRENLTEKTARLNSLKELDAGLEGYHEGVKDLLINEGNNLDIHALVADIIETSPQYELAIEAALGQRLQHIVLKDHERILKAIVRLKTDNSGRGTFIPIEPRVIKSDPAGMDGRDGVIGEAISLVSCRDGYQRVLEALLGDTIIVNDLSTALELWRNNSVRKTMVSLEGDVIEPTGAVSGGSLLNNGGGILAKKREIKELEKKLEVLREETGSLEGSSLRISGYLESLRSKAEDLRLRTEVLDKEILTAEKDITILQGDRDRLLKRIEILRMEEDQREKEKRDWEGDISRCTGNLESLVKDKEELERKVVDLNEELNEKKNDLKDLGTELMNLKLDLATLREKREGNSKEIERLKASRRKNEERILSLREEIERMNRMVNEAEGRIKETEEGLNHILGERAENIELLAKMKDDQTAFYEQIEVLQESLKKDREDLEVIQAEEGTFEVKKTELSVKIEHIVNSMRNNYNLSVEELPSVISDPEIGKEEAEERLLYLEEKLDGLGAVNMTAIEEYNELKVRYDFLMTQQTDLLQSIDSLKEAIAKIDRTTESRLREAFDLLNDKFQDVFKMLFQGGRAELILDGGDILNSGIEIVVQPPGKKLQHLSLMSGGEKALTAIALLFSSFLVKPSPLCLLDEVDAPLDDTNIERFTSILKTLSDKSQFIVITHNKRTMEAANVLYGITMEEPGVSKVISVKLNGDNEYQPALANSSN